MKSVARFAILISLLIGGCASVNYTEPTNIGPSAQVVFRPGIASGGLIIKMLDRESCPRDSWATMALFAPLLYGFKEQGPLTIKAGTRQYFRASFDDADGLAMRVTCDSAGSFVPEVGHRYIITQRRVAAGRNFVCPLSVNDLDTGMVAPSYQQRAYQASCQDVSRID